MQSEVGRMKKLIEIIHLFRKKKDKLPKSIEVALQEYRELCLEGCLIIPCKKCRHLIQINEHLYTCKRQRLMDVLWTNYRQEVEEIDNELRKKVE